MVIRYQINAFHFYVSLLHKHNQENMKMSHKVISKYLCLRNYLLQYLQWIKNSMEYYLNCGSFLFPA